MHMAGTLAASIDDVRWKQVVEAVSDDIRASLHPDEWAVLFVDGYGAHLKNSESMLVDLYERKILYFVYEPNLTQYLAPPDTHYWHGAYKSKLRRELWDHGGASTRSDFLKIAASATDLLTPRNAAKAFAYVGLSPDPRVRAAAADRLRQELTTKVQATRAVSLFVAAHPAATKLLRMDRIEVFAEKRERHRQKEKARAHISGLPRSGVINDMRNMPMIKRRLADLERPAKIAAVPAPDPAPEPISRPKAAASPKSKRSLKLKVRVGKYAAGLRKRSGAVSMRLHRPLSRIGRRKIKKTHRSSGAPDLNPMSRAAYVW